MREEWERKGNNSVSVYPYICILYIVSFLVVVLGEHLFPPSLEIFSRKGDKKMPQGIVKKCKGVVDSLPLKPDKI